MKRRWATVPAAVLVCFAPSVANAFLVVGKQKAAPSTDRVTVVAVREGGRQVMSIAPHLADKAGEIAVLIPVTDATEMRTIAPSVLTAITRVAAPRIVEVWEADPCKVHPAIEPGPMPMESASSSASAAASAGPSPKPATKSDAPKSDAPKSDAPKEAVGAASYAFEVLDGKGAVAKLKDEGYSIPAAAEPVLASYGDAGMKLVVAKIDASKLDALPPLQLLAAAQELSMPTRLLASGGGHPSLELFVVTPQHRYEAKDLENLAMPTNLDFAAGVRPKLDGFYGLLLDHAFEKKPSAIVTEYAWRASTCDACDAPPQASMVTSLGVALLPSAKEGTQQEVVVNAEGVSSEPGGPADLQSSLKSCYTKALLDKPGLAGTLRLDVEVANGAVSSAKLASDGGSAASEGPLVDCMTAAVKAAHLDKSGPLSLELSPLSRKYFGDLVVTKLRARFAAVPDKDLVLKPARAIEGGREQGPEGKPEKKVYWSSGGDDFQARYVVRHPFKGTIACDEPERGVWSVKPPKGAKPAEVKAAASLDAAIDGGAPSLDAFVIPASDPLPPAPAPSAAPDASGSQAPPPPAPPSASAAPASSAPVAPTSGGCGCELRGSASSTDALALTTLVVGVAGIARLRRARRSR